MKKFFKTALVVAAFAFVIFAVDANMATTFAAESTSGNDVSGNSNTSNTVSTVGSPSVTVTVEGSDGVKLTVSEPAAAAQTEAENQAAVAVEKLSAPAEGKKYALVKDAEVVSVDIALTEGDADGGVTVTLVNDVFVAKKTYLVMRKHDDEWDQWVVAAEENGKLKFTSSKFSLYGAVEVEVVEVKETTGSGIITSNNSNPSSGGFDKELNNQINNTAEGGVFRITKEDGRDSLTLDMVKKIVNRNLTLVMEYTYNGAEYRIVIPGKAAVIDESVPIYGPLYLAAHYSSNAAVGGNGVTYTISKGDTLSKIAATNGTTVAALAALNPQIKDVNVIYAGQSINLR